MLSSPLVKIQRVVVYILIMYLAIYYFLILQYSISRKITLLEFLGNISFPYDILGLIWTSWTINLDHLSQLRTT